MLDGSLLDVSGRRECICRRDLSQGTIRSTAFAPPSPTATPSSGNWVMVAWRRSISRVILRLGREAALKVIRPELAASLSAERFLREIEIAAKLNHPNILGLHDCGRIGGLAGRWSVDSEETPSAQPPDRRVSVLHHALCRGRVPPRPVEPTWLTTRLCSGALEARTRALYSLSPLTAARIALMCSGVVPQHPPITETPASTSCSAFSAMNAGLSS